MSFKSLLSRWVDALYLPPLRRLVPAEMFRYAVCGGANLLFDWSLYFVCYNWIFRHADWDVGFFVFSPHIASKVVSSPIALLTGFWLQKHIAFRSLSLRGGVQLLRYLGVYAVNLLINIAGIKLLVEQCGLWATPSNMVMTVITVVFSFLMQKYFTFRRK